jgi:hypothetical protein
LTDQEKGLIRCNVSSNGLAQEYGGWGLWPGTNAKAGHAAIAAVEQRERDLESRKVAVREQIEKLERRLVRLEALSLIAVPTAADIEQSLEDDGAELQDSEHETDGPTELDGEE